MPRLVEGTDVTGSLRKEVAADWGMDAVPLRVVAATTRPAPRASVSFSPVTRFFHWARRVCCSW
jgi:hypothetical protein